ncbi:hypothetical protein QQX98_009191 [Neonectria punicea]|uniref:Heterokaryon incompatibility domain-containing protein n=1 Tax=Neonectria punicea TaxID=979145 RepID=A0ABR1GT21_9HYPO
MDERRDRRCSSCTLLVGKHHSGTHLSPENPFEMAPNFLALELSARNSCHLCGIILVTILDSGKTSLTELRSYEEPVFISDSKWSSPGHSFLNISIGTGGRQRTFSIHVLTLDAPIEELVERELRRDALQDSGALLHFLLHNRHDTPNSSESGKTSDDAEFSEGDRYLEEGAAGLSDEVELRDNQEESGWSFNDDAEDTDNDEKNDDDNGDPGDTLGEIHDICTAQGLDKVVAQVKQWLATCTTMHTCSMHQDRVDGPPQLPARVLDVGNTDEPHLCLFVPKEGTRAEYISLSYCWGQGAQVKLTQATLDEMQTEIQLGLLPQTIQDAVVFTRRLGARYLWVDALCIIQADGTNEEIHVADWQREAARFGDYYQNALCTLAATSSHSVTEGLFLPSIDLLYPKYVSTQQDPVNASVDIWIPFVDVTKPLISRSPLYRRGWAIQERILSPRIVHFTRRYRIWECAELTVSERCPTRESRVLNDDGSADFVAQLRHDLVFENAEGIEKAWTGFYSHYCRLNFTKPSDRLPALSGLARRVRDMTGAKYYAGIWEGQVAENLAWHMRAFRLVDFSEASLNETGPSWCLATMERGLPRTYATGMNMDGWVWTADEELRVLHADVQCLGRDTDGLVRSGVLTLEGVFSTIDMGAVPYQRDPEQPTVWNHGSLSWNDQIYWDYVATDGEVLKPHRCLRIGTLEGGRDGAGFSKLIGAIILAPLPTNRGGLTRYRRVGFGFVPESMWEFDEVYSGVIDLW